MLRKHVFFVMAALGLMTSSAFAKVTANQVNRDIRNSGAQWEAKDNWMTELNQADLHRMMGVKLESGEGVEFAAPPSGRPSNLPASLDWRNKDGQNWVSPILNQANCGSCVAFASIGVMETQYRIAATMPLFNIKLSTQNLFSCGGGYCNFGWQPGSAASFLQRTGVTDEACMPYTSGATSKDVACSSACADSRQRTMKISGYSKPTSFIKNLEAVKAALQKGPLVTTMTVYSDFLAYSSGVYKHVTGKAEGGHAVSIVGYDDSKRAFIVRNSWGEDWGDHGFVYISYDDVSGIGNDTWLFEIPSTAGAVSVENPTQYSYFSGKIPFKATATSANARSFNMQVTAQDGRAVWSGSCVNMVNSTCADDIEISGFTDGRYDMQVMAVDSAGNTVGTSMHQTFYVVNNQPNIGIEYSGLAGLDLSKPVKGRIEFDIKTTTTSVPMSSIIFHYVGADGVDHTRSAGVVLPSMTMGWRTNVVPNGQYEIWMEGHVTTGNFDAIALTPKRTVTVQN